MIYHEIIIYYNLVVYFLQEEMFVKWIMAPYGKRASVRS